MFQVAVCPVVLFHYMANGIKQLRKLKQSAKPKDKLQTTMKVIKKKTTILALAIILKL